MQRFIFLIAGLLVSDLSTPDGCDLSKKEIKETGRYFSGPVELERIPWPGDTAMSMEYLHENDCLFSILESGTQSGYVFKTRAMGRFDYFDYMLLFSLDAEVLGVAVTRYRSDHGGGICRRSWLNQFEGYRGGKLELGKEIDWVSGGTISATSIVEDVQRCHRLMGSIIGH